MHEAQMHEFNQFVTLTYKPETLPQYGHLKPKHFRQFMKDLRKKRPAGSLRYFHCGEYGDENKRPHYHALIFGLRLDDLYPFTRINGHLYYRSPELENIWQKGHVTIGRVTFKSAAYVARYIIKKQGGENAHKHYEQCCEITGEILQERQLPSEYATMSNRPGIGASWYEQYGDSDCHDHDRVVMDGKNIPVPRYYDKLLDRKDPERLEQIKRRRHENRDKDIHPDRLDVREFCQFKKLQTLKRGYENDSESI